MVKGINKWLSCRDLNNFTHVIINYASQKYLNKFFCPVLKLGLFSILIDNFVKKRAEENYNQ